MFKRILLAAALLATSVPAMADENPQLGGNVPQEFALNKYKHMVVCPNSFPIPFKIPNSLFTGFTVLYTDSLGLNSHSTQIVVTLQSPDNKPISISLPTSQCAVYTK